MSLQNILDISDARDNKKTEISEQRVAEQLNPMRKLVAFYREYPDLFVDQLLKDNNPHNFQFYVYQRIFLRITMRHRYVYATFPRAYSKSFLSMLILMLRCILYPNSHLFVTTGGRLIFI